MKHRKLLKPILEAREAELVKANERLLRGPRTEWQTAVALSNELLKLAMPSLILEKFSQKWNIK